MNNLKTNADTNLAKINNKNMTSKNCGEKQERQNENKAPKLNIVTNADQTKTNGSIINVVNDLSKAQSPIIEKNSTDFIINIKEKQTPSLNKPKTTRPIMGCSALLKKANTESDDSIIVHELIIEGLINTERDHVSSVKGVELLQNDKRI